MFIGKILSRLLFSLFTISCAAMNGENPSSALKQTPQITAATGTRHQRCSPMKSYRFPELDAHPRIAPNTLFFGIFDSIGKPWIAEHAAQHFYKLILDNEFFAQKDILKALTCAYEKYDAQLSKKGCKSSGCTASTVLFHEKKLWAANVGDTEIIGCFDGKTATPLSAKHTPDCDHERKRITSHQNAYVMRYAEGQFQQTTQGVLTIWNDPDVQDAEFSETHFLKAYESTGKDTVIKQNKIPAQMGFLSTESFISVSRALGCSAFKPLCIATPNVKSLEIKKPGFVILASRSFWNTMSYQAAVDIVLSQLKIADISLATVPQYGAEAVINFLIGQAENFNSIDSMAATVIFFSTQ